MFVQITGVKRQVLISICLYIGQMSLGYGLLWSGPVTPKLRDLSQSPLPYLLTESQLSLVASMTYIGAITGPYVMTWLSNKKGRKPCLVAGGLVFVSAYVILAAARNLVMLYIGRYVAGFAGGSINVLNLVYMGEMASPRIRGILLTVFGIFMTLGSILLFSTAPYVSYWGTAYIGLALSLVNTATLMWIPETPLFYALQNKPKEMMKVLVYLDRSHDIDEHLKKKQEFTETNTKREWIELFSVKTNRKALFIVVGINILQHTSGVLAIAFFSAAIFEMAGSSIPANLAMIIIGCFQLTGSMVTPFFIDGMAGRKMILIISCAVCSLCMFLLGLYFYLDHIGSPLVDNIKWLPLVILIFHYIGYDSGLGIIPNAIIGEVFTSNVRSKGSTITMTASWVFGFAVTTTFGALLDTVGGHVLFWFFSVTCACAVLFSIFFVPETKGKTLLEIQDAL